MANSPQARKRAKQSEKRRKQNASMRATTRTYVKRVLAAIEEGDVELAKTAYAEVVPVLDRAADKGGILHKNKAARYKSRLNAQVKAMSA